MLDSIDRQIVGILQQDGRTPNVDIARRIGVSEATIRKRLDKLVAEDVIRIRAIPNAAKVNLSTVTFITCTIDLAQLDRIANQLARLHEVRAIYYTTGASDLIVEAWFCSADELLRFLTQRVASIPGIKGTATSHVLRTIKDGSHWILPPASPQRILVVDDDPDFVEIARTILTAEGFEVVCANCGEAGLTMMRLAKPDLVILDVMMQGILDGLRTAKEMRADGELCTVPILLVSSIGDSAFAGLMPWDDSLPVDNLLVKPVDGSALVAEAWRLVRGG